MPEDSASEISIFWSWQLDSPSKENRNFIEDCLKKAAKRISKIEAKLIAVDRDTEGVGGTPPIADTILSKIRSADLFVWDATLAYRVPRPAPNPNVLLELGYALAVVGEGRIIGVMNTANHPGPRDLPFDLRHRRWPIAYELSPVPWHISVAGRLSPKFLDEYSSKKKIIRDRLVTTLESAIIAALKEPRRGAIHSDVDYHAASNLWKQIDSAGLRDWIEWRRNNPQFEKEVYLNKFELYVRIATQPENQFRDERLASTHAEVLNALHEFLRTTSIQMVPLDAGAPGVYVISVKAARRFVENYDERYDEQIDLIGKAAEHVWSAWTRYITELRSRYPEITTT